MAADWTLHKGECNLNSDGGVSNTACKDNDDDEDDSLSSTAALEALEEEGLRDDSDHPLEGETVIVYGLQAHPEWNYCVGLVEGPATETGRYPTLITFTSSPSCRVSVKPCNLHRVNVAIQKELLPLQSSSSSSSAAAAARDVIVVLHKYTCSLHEEEMCGRCCVDFRIANHLRKVVKQQSTTAGTGSNTAVPLNVIESVAATHFAKNPFRECFNFDSFDNKKEGKEGDEDDTSHHGINDEKKRNFEGLLAPFAAILRDALLVKNPSLSVAALIVGLSTYGGARSPLIRPQVTERLQLLLQLSSSSS